MESWHRETSHPVCARILELSPRLPRQMHPLAALNSTAYAPSWSARPTAPPFIPPILPHNRFLSLDCCGIDSQKPRGSSFSAFLFQSNRARSLGYGGLRELIVRRFWVGSRAESFLRILTDCDIVIVSRHWASLLRNFIILFFLINYNNNFFVIFYWNNIINEILNYNFKV